MCQMMYNCVHGKHLKHRLKRLATATALPVARPSGNGGTTSGGVPEVVGKVTPVRYESAQDSGQEEKRAHFLDSSFDPVSTHFYE